MTDYDIVIIGGGPAGLTAAIYACRAGWRTLLIEKGAFGGQAAITDLIENYPGFVEGIAGPELMNNFYEQAIHFGCQTLNAEVTGIQPVNPAAEISAGTKAFHTVETADGPVRGKAVLIATGAQARELGIPGEKEFQGKGVSYCATCDGFFFRNKKVAVIGGGDAAVKEALFLANLVREVVVIHRRDTFRADKYLSERVKAVANIKIYWDTVAKEINGEKIISSLTLQNVKTQEKFSEAVDGVFVYVGRKPNTDFLARLLLKNEQGYLHTEASLRTAIPGIFAIGDCRQKQVRQVATAVGDGACVSAALEEYMR